MSELKPCPICGKTETLKISDCVAIEDCDRFEICDKVTFKLIVCDYNKGGCGTSSGYRPTKEQAIEAWNDRYEPTCKMTQGINEYSHETEWKCSECGASILRPVLPWRENFYCPGCGARVEAVE